MANQKDIDLIFQLLKTNTSKNSKHRKVYELGYLVGFLASLMDADSTIRHAVIRHINRKLNKQ